MPDQNYSVKDFLLNEHFQQWVKFPTPEREAYWQHFLLLHPEAEQEMKEARIMLEQLDFKVQARPQSTKASIKERIDKAIIETPLAKQQLKKNRLSQPFQTRKLHPKVWLRIAAAVSGLVFLAGVYLLLNTSSGLEYTTAYGERKTIILPDESVVTLNANSSLIIQESNWSNNSNRVVWLQGEAFFEVEKRNTSEGEPIKFMVETGDVNVEVLGTAFNVNARHQQTKVVLNSGSVKLKLQQEKDTAQAIVMEPGDMVAIDKDKRKIVKKVVDTLHYTAWKENRLIFDRTPITEIIQLIEDNYGLKVSVRFDNLLKREFTGAAPADDVDVLLDKMTVVYNLNIRRNGREIIITDK